MSRAGWSAAAALLLGAGAVTVAWADRDGNDAAPPTFDGASLFEAKGCASCHVGPDSAPKVEGVPPLLDAASWAGSRRTGLTARDYLAESIRSPAAFISPVWRGGGPEAMPDLALDEDEIDALVTYLLQG